MKRLISVNDLKTACLILLVSLLSACGYHLRGNDFVPETLTQISLTSSDPYSTIKRDVETELRLNHVSMVAPAATIPNVHILSESEAKKTLSLYPNSRAAEKRLIYIMGYRVTVPDLGSKTFSITVTRNYLQNPSTALAKSVEEDLLYDEMRVQASKQLIRQLASLKTQIEQGSMNALEETTDSAISPDATETEPMWTETEITN